ncbi:MAG: gluconate 2-dehydrogenase subunit 3 family protein [Candidatus Solibacter usitatus]|nr:gluconate 2-dehydrogenase subunit 3 family protein [Candidatus Solibacter usitatus]
MKRKAREMERRVAVQALAGVMVAGPIAAQPASGLRFFGPAEDALLNRLTELILPADSHSPGAREAQVSRFIDLMVSHSDPQVRDLWRTGLRAVDGEASRRFSQTFLASSPAQQDQILRAMASSEKRPETELERFFVRLKSMTIDGYYTSAIGIHRDLRYQGNRALDEFPGCRHPEHR